MKQLILLHLFLAPLFFIESSKGFPEVSAERLDGSQVNLPEHFEGKFTLIGIASGQQAEEELRTWQEPVYNKFIAKTGLMDDMFDVNICFLPLFTGAARMAKPKIVKKLKEDNNPLVESNLYIYTGELDPFKEIGVVDKKTPYFLLLNERGEILWKAEGSFKRDHLDEVEEILTR